MRQTRQLKTDASRTYTTQLSMGTVQKPALKFEKMWKTQKSVCLKPSCEFHCQALILFWQQLPNILGSFFSKKNFVNQRTDNMNKTWRLVIIKSFRFFLQQLAPCIKKTRYKQTPETSIQKMEFKMPITIQKCTNPFLRCFSPLVSEMFLLPQ